MTIPLIVTSELKSYDPDAAGFTQVVLERGI